MFLIFDVMCGARSAYLRLDDVPGVSQAYVVFWVVESQPILQILLGVLTHLETKKTTPALVRDLGLKGFTEHVNWVIALITAFISE